MSDLIRGNISHPYQYTAITSMDGANADMLMDYGILRLNQGHVFKDNASLEKAYLLVYGRVSVQVGDQDVTLERKNCFDVAPIVIHADREHPVTITGLCPDSEVCLMRTDNDNAFGYRIYLPEDTPDEYRGKGLMQETSTRIVRTVFDKTNAPYANLVVGEVIGFPGKWSSYPPHHHPQPEIYYYKMNPQQGFAYAECGEDIHKIRHNDTLLLRGGMTHPHVTPPGYALWYLWVIRHLPDNPYGTPTFVPEHTWVAEPGAVYWPERKKP